MNIKKKTILDIVEVLVIAFAIAFLLIKFVLIPCRVTGSSMHSTLEDGDFGYSFVCTRNSGISRFDIVVVKTDDKLLVKRVIGLPNEKIEYKNNKLYINGEYLEEEFLSDDAITKDFTYEIGDNQYFCMGDNRYISKDSRYYGAFDVDRLVSTHLFVVFPFGHFGYHN
ncbi:MAG: signal peptidase I [Firmicutes bacterium]|nr:signal peptidase I [Candidatus Colivicinus equi]